jgi:hypothetical protein
MARYVRGTFTLPYETPKFSKMKLIKKRTKRTTRGKAKNHGCKFCSFSFSNKKQLKLHTMLFHFEETPSKTNSSNSKKEEQSWGELAEAFDDEFSDSESPP